MVANEEKKNQNKKRGKAKNPIPRFIVIGPSFCSDTLKNYQVRPNNGD
jgi:hypothetical protein